MRAAMLYEIVRHDNRIKREHKIGWRVLKDSEKFLTGTGLYESKAVVCHSAISRLSLFSAKLTYSCKFFYITSFRFSPSPLITYVDKRVLVTGAIRILPWGEGEG